MANDLDIRIAATDLASNVLSSIGNNVKALGQAAESSFNSIQNSAQAAGSELSQGSTLIVGGVGGLATVGRALATVGGLAFTAAGAIAGIGAASLIAAKKAERELGKVGSTLRLIEAQRLDIPVNLVGMETIDPILAKVKQVADQIEFATNVKSSKIVDLAGSAAKQGFNPAEMDQTLKGAAGLASAFGTSLEDGLSKVRQAAEGNFSAFENLIPQINTLTTDEEKLAAVAKLASDGLILQSESAMAAEDILSRLSNGVGNLFQRIGEGSSVTQIFAGTLSDILFPVIDFVDQKIVDLGDTADWLKESFKTSFAFISAISQATWNNIGSILERAKLSFFLFAEQSALDLEHTFTVKLPSYAIWFGDNFVNILQDLGSAALTIVGNIGSNIADAFMKYWHFITEGWSQGESLSDLASSIGDIASRNLLDGFSPVTEGLPEIADRAMSQVEKDLIAQMSGIDKKLADDFTAAFNSSLGEIDRALADAKLDTKVNLENIKPPKPGDLPTQTVESKVNQAFESRVMVRGPSDDPMKKLLDVQTKMLEETKKQSALLEKNQTIKQIDSAINQNSQAIQLEFVD